MEGPGVPPDQVRQGHHHKVLRLRRGDALPAAGHGWQWEEGRPRFPEEYMCYNTTRAGSIPKNLRVGIDWESILYSK